MFLLKNSTIVFRDYVTKIFYYIDPKQANHVIDICYFNFFYKPYIFEFPEFIKIKNGASIK